MLQKTQKCEMIMKKTEIHRRDFLGGWFSRGGGGGGEVGNVKRAIARENSRQRKCCRERKKEKETGERASDVVLRGRADRTPTI